MRVSLQFSQNGGCGYVLKPQWMVNPSPAGLPTREPKQLSVTVHSAYVHQGKAMFCYRDDLFVQVRDQWPRC